APDVEVETMVGLVRDGLKKFPADAAIYIRPMYWPEQGGYLAIPADPESTRFLLCMYETPMPPASGFSVGLSPYRRPTVESMPTDAKAGCLYPNNGRAITEARSRGFDNALVRDMLGNVAETGTSNVFMVKDGVVMTPMPNRSFLNGITRQRVIGLLRESGAEVVETVLTVEDFLDADEIFSTGNYSKVVPITRIEDRVLQPGPLQTKARKLY